MQITVTEHNDWESESWSYIFNGVSEYMLAHLRSALSTEIEDGIIDIDENTNYTEEVIFQSNRLSKNIYMPRYGFYEFPELSLPLSDDPDDDDRTIYTEIFYKAKGLVK